MKRMRPLPLMRTAGAVVVAALLLGAGAEVPARVPLRLSEGRLEAHWDGAWRWLGDIPYYTLFPERDPARHLPADIPEPAATDVRALHARLRAANDGLWGEVVHLRELSRAVVPWDAPSQAYRAALQEGEDARLRMMESNGYHFFLDATLLLPEGVREAWFASVEAWTPPPIPTG